ncbi:cellobiose 2-epimerase [archaeon BMS3Abin16]|nr:cellobiose 2-epimerase [archaeon BMS3Abin16]
MKNKLKDEKSPYLRQHADNPVDWYPWGDEAFEKARAEDKPIFLSIGYSTCHWCHVMARESFEDPEVARLMNDAFVSVKVDREERPDIDSAYMAAAQLITGAGGWPLTIIMTPDKKPFFAATYLPKESRGGRMGMVDLIPRVKQLWTGQREDALKTAEELTRQLKNIGTQAPGASIDKTLVEKAVKLLSERFDKEHGGFSDRPKFPTPHNILFLLRRHRKSGSTWALRMAETTLENMAMGGIYDHIGHGFHRYSTDEGWILPHFEKMLYDQALLAIAYTEAYQATKKQVYLETAEEVLTYVLRDLRSSEGGFYSAEDADSEGVEGKFYLWSFDELFTILGREKMELATRAYNLDIEGNYIDEATRWRTGSNILYLAKPLDELAEEMDRPVGDVKAGLKEIGRMLFETRRGRVRPSLDDKILCDWNGLMIAALSVAGRVFDDERYVAAAKKAADFILEKMLDSDGRLLHRYKDGEAGIPGFLEDYAFLCWGLIELYETTFDAKYLSHAVAFTNMMILHFWDGVDGGFYHTAADGEELILRKKEVYDGATPSGNSVAMHNLLRLSRLTANADFEARAEAVGRAFSKMVSQYPAGYTYLLSAVDFMVGPSREVVIVGAPDAVDTEAMLNVLRGEYLPNTVVLFKSTNEKALEITKIAEFTRDHTAIDGKATAYVCTNQACKKPTTDPEEMMKLLDF